MPLNHCEHCDNDDEKPSFKGNQVRGSSCDCDTQKEEDSLNVKWHWNPTIGKDA